MPIAGLVRRKTKHYISGACYLLFALKTDLPFFKSAAYAIVIGGGTALAIGWIQENAENNRLSRIRIGSIPLPTEIECRHVLVAGTTGAGKSQAIFLIVNDARVRGDRGLVLDVGGVYLSRFYREGDLILSPGDARSVKWNPFLDLQSAFDYADLARAVIPDGKGGDATWHLYGQIIFGAVLRSLHQTGDYSVTRLLHLVGSASLDELAPILIGTPAASFSQPGNEKMLGNTRAIIGTFLVPWTFLEDGGDFSVKQWTRASPSDQWLFITYRDNQIAALRQLLTCWLQLAISETLSLDEHAIRTWFIADEFDTLGTVSAAKDALTKLRKYRGSCVFGLQSISQLRATYGRDEASTLLSCLSSKLYLRQGDPETAEYCSKDLGERQIMRPELSKSKKTGLGGDGNESIAERHVTEALVMPSELQKLPDLHAFLSLAGDYPIGRVKIPIVDLPRVVKPFVTLP